jgi:hypothetical protein
MWRRLLLISALATSVVSISASDDQLDPAEARMLPAEETVPMVMEAIG